MRDRSHKQKRYLTYQGKLTLIFTVMTVSVIITFTFLMMKRQQDNLKDTLYRTISVENQKNSMNLYNIFETIKDLTAALALSENIYESLEELPVIADRTDLYSLEIQQGIFKTMLISKLATMNQMQDMKLYSKNGLCAYVTRQRSGIEESSFWEQDWFEAFVVHGKDWMFTMSGTSDMPRLSLYRTVRDVGSGVLVGYLEVNFDFTSYVREILEESSLEAENRYYLMEITGEDSIHVITNAGDEKGGLLAREGMLPVLSLGAEELEEEKIYEVNVGGQELLLAASWVVESDLLLVNGVPSAVLKEQAGGAIRLFLGILLLGTSAAIGISYLTAKGLSRNIQKLNRAMIEAEKNPEIQVEIHSRDEIEMLGKSFNRMIVKLQKTYSDLYRAEIDLKEAQNLALQAQINPHFLYNTLETIDALSACERTEDIGRMVQSLSQVFRYAMEEKRSVTLKEELSHVTQYLQILQMRYEDRFAFSIEADQEMMDMEIPKIILQPLAENAIIHSLLKAERKGMLVIRAKVTKDSSVITVADNGTGMTEDTRKLLMEKLDAGAETSKGRKHIGVQNVHRRLSYFYGDNYHMEINSERLRETSVSIWLKRRWEQG